MSPPSMMSPAARCVASHGGARRHRRALRKPQKDESCARQRPPAMVDRTIQVLNVVGDRVTRDPARVIQLATTA